MAESKIKFKKCSLLPNEGSGLDEEYNVLAGAPLLNYYESITSPSISATLGFLDIDQVISRKGIFGGEYIDIIIQIDGFDDFKLTQKDHNLFCNSVRDLVTTENKQFATLDFISVESIINETARVNKKFTGNVSQTVFEVLIGDKKGLQTNKNLNKDEAANSYSFVGNLKKPFDTIQWLQPKTQSSKKSFGFLFFENLDGYHFRSIESLLDQESLPPYFYTDSPFDSEDRPIILQNKVESTNDIGLNCRLGMYANKTIYIDIENQEASVDDFSIEQLKLRKPPKLMEGLEKHPTRLMLRVDDVGVAQVGAAKSETVPKSELAKYQNKSYIRNNLLFSQSLSISIPLNSTLRVGVVIDIKLPTKKGDGTTQTDSFGSEKGNDPSGRYLIAELRHLIGRGKSETQLKLIRDVFTPSTDAEVQRDNEMYGNTFPDGSF